MPTVLAAPSTAVTRVVSVAVAAFLALAVVALGVKVGADGDGFGHGFGIGERSPSSATAVPVAALVDFQRAAPSPALQQTLHSVLPPEIDQPAAPVAPTSLEPAPSESVAVPVAPTPAPASEPGPSDGAGVPGLAPLAAPLLNPMARHVEPHNTRADPEPAGLLRTMPTRSIPGFEHAVENLHVDEGVHGGGT